jgi:hypothetical protein
LTQRLSLQLPQIFISKLEVYRSVGSITGHRILSVTGLFEISLSSITGTAKYQPLAQALLNHRPVLAPAVLQHRLMAPAPATHPAHHQKLLLMPWALLLLLPLEGPALLLA